MFVTKATILSSGDQLVAPMFRVLYSFSTEKGCTSRFKTLLVICFGSVIASAAADANCDSRDADQRKTATNERSLNIAVEFTTATRSYGLAFL